MTKNAVENRRRTRGTALEHFGSERGFGCGSGPDCLTGSELAHPRVPPIRIRSATAAGRIVSVMRFLKDERGQASILLAVCMVVVVGIAGLAVDVGHLRYAKQLGLQSHGHGLRRLHAALSVARHSLFHRALQLRNHARGG